MVLSWFWFHQDHLISLKTFHCCSPIFPLYNHTPPLCICKYIYITNTCFENKKTTPKTPFDQHFDLMQVLGWTTVTITSITVDSLPTVGHKPVLGWFILFPLPTHHLWSCWPVTLFVFFFKGRTATAIHPFCLIKSHTFGWLLTFVEEIPNLNWMSPNFNVYLLVRKSLNNLTSVCDQNLSDPPRYRGN